MDALRLLTGIRFLDSFFPSGGFAYSSGLEAAVENGAVRNGEDLSRYVLDLLRHSIGPRDAVAVATAHAQTICGNVSGMLKCDQELDGMIWARECRQAGRQMGRQVLRMAARHFTACSALQDYCIAVEAGAAPGHMPVAIGVTLAAAGWAKDLAIAGYLYQTAVGYVSAALKLLPIGQREGQRLLQEWSGPIAQISQAVDCGSPLRSWNPIQDIYAMRHSRLGTRLFRS